MTQDPFDDHNSHLNPLPDNILLDLARNECAPHGYRLSAVEILRTRKSPKLMHEDIRWLVNELEIELSGIQFEHPAPSGPGPMTSSVTTKMMFADGPPEEET